MWEKFPIQEPVFCGLGERPACLDDLVFLPANLSRLVIDPYREACRIGWRLGERLALDIPFFVAGHGRRHRHPAGGDTGGVARGLRRFAAVDSVRQTPPLYVSWPPARLPSRTQPTGICRHRLNRTVQSRCSSHCRGMGTMGDVLDDVLDDVTDDNIDAHHVLRRVDDWKARVKRLHATASEWLPEDWTARADARASSVVQEFYLIRSSLTRW